VKKAVVPRAERVQINHEFASVEAFINEYVANISHSGVFIRSKDPLPIGTRVALKFTIIMDELETIEGIGEVVRRTKNPSGMGVLFVELTSHSQDLVAKLITQRSRDPQRTHRVPPLPPRSSKPPPPPPAAARRAKSDKGR